MKTMSAAALIMLGLLVAHRGIGQQADEDRAIARLQDAATSDAALQEIKTGSSELQSAIVSKLPSLMANEKEAVILDNESRLAGELKVIACIPTLIVRYVRGDVLPMGTTSTMRWRMVDDPAGQALVKIGDPVIPSISKLLKSDQKDVREKAIRVLGNIKSPAAIDALAAHRSSESNEYNQYLIDKLVTSRN
jgi:HEAT repeat protein